MSPKLGPSDHADSLPEAMRVVPPGTRKRFTGILVRSTMPHTDLVAPSAQSQGHVSDGVYRLAAQIYDPEHDKDGATGIERLNIVVDATRQLEEGQGGRYRYRKAALRALERRLKRSSI